MHSSLACVLVIMLGALTTALGAPGDLHARRDVPFSSVLSASPYRIVPGPALEDWPADAPDDFARQIVADRRPRVFGSSPASTWPAMAKWSRQYIVEHVPELTRVYLASDPAITFFDRTRPMANLSGVVWDPEVKFMDMASRTYYELEDDASTPSWLYYTGPIELWPKRMRRDLNPLEFLRLDEKWVVSAWLGFQGVIAHPHYDVYDNLYVMLQGRKKFHLFGPDETLHMYLHPRLHPGHRQAQVNFTALDLARHPRAARATAVEVVLQPGQMLYLPPYWYHRVEALDSSISVNVWSETPETKLLARADTIGVPVNATWQTPLRLLAARNYIHRLLSALASADAAFVRAADGRSAPEHMLGLLYETRYAPLEPVLSASASLRFAANCHSLALTDLAGHEAAVTPGGTEAIVAAAAKRMLVRVRDQAKDWAAELGGLRPASVRFMQTLDLIEEYVRVVFGVNNVAPFLAACGRLTTGAKTEL